jgi:hypothetical protein
MDDVRRSAVLQSVNEACPWMRRHERQYGPRTAAPHFSCGSGSISKRSPNASA